MKLTRMVLALSGILFVSTAVVPRVEADLCVSSSGTNQVLRYQEGTGAFLGICASGGGLNSTQGVAFGPDGNLYVTGFGNNVVLRYSGTTGAFIDVFASGGGLNSGTGLAFGPDGNLYVNSYYTQSVLRYNGTTGAFINTFANVPGGFPTGLTFGPDGNLYVSNGFGNQVVRFNGTTGAFLGVFAAGGGLSGSEGVTFGPDGNLYVASTFSNEILRYNGPTGAFMNVFASGGLNQPTAVVFRPDGNLYVTTGAPNGVVRFNGTTGAFVDVFIPAGSGGLSSPTFMAFGPATVEVQIDIKPGNFPNPIPDDPDPLNLSAKGVVPVAIFTTGGFDAATVSASTVQFAGAPALRSTLEDVDLDGDLDMVLHFDNQALQLTCADTQAMLTGQTTSSTSIEGVDSIRVLKDKNGNKCP